MHFTALTTLVIMASLIHINIKTVFDNGYAMIGITLHRLLIIIIVIMIGSGFVFIIIIHMHNTQ